jgi:hypothetical protein
MLAATLESADPAASRNVSDDLTLEIITNIGKVTGLYDEVMAERKAQDERERQRQEEAGAKESRDLKRARVLIGAFSQAGIDAQTGEIFGGRKMLLTLDEAEKLTALLALLPTYPSKD